MNFRGYYTKVSFSTFLKNVLLYKLFRNMKTSRIKAKILSSLDQFCSLTSAKSKTLQEIHCKKHLHYIHFTN